MKRALGWIQALIMSSLAGVAWAHPVGPNVNSQMQPLVSDVPFVEGINPWRPPVVNLTGNPEAPPWIKNFQGPVAGEPDPLAFQTGIGILERINIGQQGIEGPHWKRWIERIVTPGWEWGSGALRVNGQPALTFAGVLSDPDNDGLNDIITFSFPVLEDGVGNFIAIEKIIRCADKKGCPNMKGTMVTVHQWPVVPAPGAFGLMALGLSVLPLMLAACGGRSDAPGSPTGSDASVA